MNKVSFLICIIQLCISEEGQEEPEYKEEWYNENRPEPNAKEADKIGFCKMCCVCNEVVDKVNFVQVNKSIHDKSGVFYFPIEAETGLETINQAVIELYQCNNTFMKSIPLKPNQFGFPTQNWQDFHSNQYKTLEKEKLLNIIQEPILQQSSDEYCSKECKCPDSVRKMDGREIVEMKQKELEKAEKGELAGPEVVQKRPKKDDEMFDMSMLKMDKKAGLADDLGKLAKAITEGAVGEAIREGKGLSIWSVLKLVMLIVSLKLMQVSFKSQQQMAVMAAQAPLMMMNPLSMFGFNPMNQSAALENAGQPAKFAQVNTGNAVSGVNNPGYSPETMKQLEAMNMAARTPLMQSQAQSQNPKGYLDTAKSQMGYKQQAALPDKKTLMNNIDVFYDNFRKGMNMASKENNMGNIFGMINHINEMNNGVMSGGTYLQSLLDENNNKPEMKQVDDKTPKLTIDEGLRMVQGLLKHNQATQLEKTGKFKQKSNSDKINKEAKIKNSKTDSTNSIQSKIKETVKNMTDEFSSMSHNNDDSIIKNMKQFAENAKNQALPEKDQKPWTLGDMFNSLNYQKQ